MRIRFFEFSPVFDEIWSAHRLFSFRANIDNSGSGADVSRDSRPISVNGNFGRRPAAQANFDVLAARRRSTRPLARYARRFDEWFMSGMVYEETARFICHIYGCTEFVSSRLFSRCALSAISGTAK